MTTLCPEELLGRRRAGRLNADQAQLLDEHIQSCANCASDEGLHESFDRDGHPQMLDEALLARVVARTLLKRPRRRSQRPWKVATGVAAALVMAAGLASAAAWIYSSTTSPTRHGSETVPNLATPPVRLALRAPAPVTELASAEPASAEPASAEPASAEPAPAERPRTTIARPHTHRRPIVQDEPSVAPALGLEAIFAAANEARRAGQLEQAGDLYAELQRRFPNSREAQLSLISYGRILLDRGRATEALAQFQQHLRVDAGGVLAAEALYGQARALTRLHREPEARSCWADLLSRFPDSIFADVARSQLGARP